MRNEYRHYQYVTLKVNKNMTNKEKKEEVHRYLLRYKKYLLKIKYCEIIDSSEEIEMMNQYINYINSVFEELSTQSKYFLKMEYLNNKENDKWWIGKYNRSTYFKVRENAVEEFLQYVS